MYTSVSKWVSHRVPIAAAPGPGPSSIHLNIQGGIGFLSPLSPLGGRQLLPYILIGGIRVETQN